MVKNGRKGLCAWTASKPCSKAEKTAKSWCRATAKRACSSPLSRKLRTKSPCHLSADLVVPLARVGKAEQADKPRAIGLQADLVSAIRPRMGRVGRVGKAAQAIGLRAAPMAAVPLPVVRVHRAENPDRALREVRVVRVELVAVDSDLQPGL